MHTVMYTHTNVQSNATESLCFASDEGYGSVMACSTARPAQVEIAFLPVTEDTRTDEAKLQDMLMVRVPA